MASLGQRQQQQHQPPPPPSPRRPTMQSSQSSSTVNNGQASNSAKSPDYVYFDRTTAGFSDDAVPRAKAAQLKLEHYYKVAVDAAIERNQRCVSVCLLAASTFSPIVRGYRWNMCLCSFVT